VLRVSSTALVAGALVLALVLPLAQPPRLAAQGVDVFLNVTGGGARKLNIAVPEFTVVTGTDPERCHQRARRARGLLGPEHHRGVDMQLAQ